MEDRGTKFATFAFRNIVIWCACTRDAQLCFCFPIKMLILNAPFSRSPPKSHRILNNAHHREAFFGSVYVSRKLPTYPSPKLTLTLSSHLGQNDGLGEG